MTSDDKSGVIYDKPTGLSKSPDIAPDILETTDQHDLLYPATERRLVRKIDLVIVIPICDKDMLGYTAVLNLRAPGWH
jgi:hypothetical protein